MAKGWSFANPLPAPGRISANKAKSAHSVLREFDEFLIKLLRLCEDSFAKNLFSIRCALA